MDPRPTDPARRALLTSGLPAAALTGPHPFTASAPDDTVDADGQFPYEDNPRRRLRSVGGRTTTVMYAQQTLTVGLRPGRAVTLTGSAR
ncbi:hypothetical protein [Streptomyces rishiriensis]|uniref:hypothetical protein n=1 Tax=Streptomyces rishiriensis TaxID=68264 RepID=UPI00142D90DF|nr:hypothetical protein [Streptomyces rishiriensis]